MSGDLGLMLALVVIAAFVIGFVVGKHEEQRRCLAQHRAFIESHRWDKEVPL